VRPEDLMPITTRKVWLSFPLVALAVIVACSAHPPDEASSSANLTDDEDEECCDAEEPLELDGGAALEPTEVGGASPFGVKPLGPPVKPPPKCPPKPKAPNQPPKVCKKDAGSGGGGNPPPRDAGGGHNNPPKDGGGSRSDSGSGDGGGGGGPGGILGTGCASITISDARWPPKHPPMPVPLPSDWDTRNPAYGPPASPTIDPQTNCRAGKNPTQLRCSLKIGKETVDFNCMRDTPGGKAPANGGACNFHCYVD